MRARPHSWSEVTAVFGGTFDPPHLGHRKAIQGLFSSPGVARVLVIPSPSPPHKPALASVEDRVEMARLAFAPSHGSLALGGPVEISLLELERARLHPEQPSFTFDTLMELKARVGPHLAFVLGTDQLLQFHTWHRFPDILGLAHWIVLERKGGTDGSEVLAGWEPSGLTRREQGGWRVSPHLGGTFLQTFETPAPELSSTRIREEMARHGQPPEGTLLPEVEAYLMRRGIYGTRVLNDE